MYGLQGRDEEVVALKDITMSMDSEIVGAVQQYFSHAPNVAATEIPSSPPSPSPDGAM